MLKLGKIFKRYRIKYYRKKLLKDPTYFINQLNESSSSQQCFKKDVKEIGFYPTLLNSSSDIKLNKLVLILSAENFFLCNGETVTDNMRVIEYQMKLNNISDNFYRECYSNSAEYETGANEAYSQINSLLAAAKSASSKRFRISPFFNYWHNYLTRDHWQLSECELETDDFIIVKYKLYKKKHKNYVFDPCLLFGATKENLYIGLDTDENHFICWLKIGLLIDVSKKQIIPVGEKSVP